MGQHRLCLPKMQRPQRRAYSAGSRNVATPQTLQAETKPCVISSTRFDEILLLEELHPLTIDSGAVEGESRDLTDRLGRRNHGRLFGRQNRAIDANVVDVALKIRLRGTAGADA